MRTIIRACALSALVASCAAVRVTGTDFPSAPFAALRLRQTTDAQAEALLGPPFRRAALQGIASNPKGAIPVGTHVSVAVLNYAYSLSSGGPAASGHPVGKFATLVFYDGILLAYDVNSSIPGDESPPIDDSRLPLLKQGSSTRDDVIGLMGPPSGQSTAVPFAAQTVGHLSYVWTHIDGSQVRHKVLLFDFDSNDVMTRYAMTDVSGPLPATAGLPGVTPGMPYLPPYRAPSMRPPTLVVPKPPPAPLTTRS